MDLSSIRPKDAAEATSAPHQAGTQALGGLSLPFAQLLQPEGQLARLRLNASLDPFAARADAAVSATELAPPADDHAYQRRDLDDDGYFDNRAADAPKPDQSPPTDTDPGDHDDFGRERAAERGDNRTEPPGSEGQPDDTDTATDTTSNDDTGTTESPDADASTETDDAKTAETTAPDEATVPTETGTPTTTGLDQATATLAGLTPSTDTATIPGQAAVPAQDQAAAQAHSQRQNAVNGLTRAQDSVAAAVTRTQAAPGTSTPAASTEEPPAGDRPQSTPSDGSRPAASAATQVKGASSTAPANTQSAALSEKIGPGSPVQVRVMVTDPAEQMVSRPASTLSTPSIFGGNPGANPDAATAQTQGGATPAQGGASPAQSSSGGNATTGQAAQNAAVAIAPGQGQQTSAQATLAQSAPTAGAGSGGPAQGAANANPSAQPLQASGDAPTTGNAGTPAGIEQTQQAKAAGRPVAASRPPSFKPAVADQVNVQIIKALKSGIDRINIQLRPASLGRVDVQMEMAHDGRVTAVITADNKDTLDLLQRDAKNLEKALQAAGLQTDSDSLSFSLRSNDGEAGEGGRDQAAAHAPEEAGADGEADGESLDDILDRLIAGDFENDDPGLPRIDIQV